MSEQFKDVDFKELSEQELEELRATIEDPDSLEFDALEGVED